MQRTSIRRAGFETVVAGVATQAILMASGIVVARLLGVENRGHLALMTLFPLILTMTGTLGLHTATTYYVAQGHSTRAILRVVRGTAIRQAVLLLAIEAVILVAVFWNETPGIHLAAAFSALGVPALVMLLWAQAILQGEHRYRAWNMARLSGPLLYSAILVLVFVADSEHIALVAGVWSVTLFVASLLTLMYALRHAHREGKPAPPLDEMKRFGVKGMVGWISPLETFQLDQLFIGLALTASDLGLYVVGAAFTNLTRLFVPQSLGMIAYPHVAAKRTRAEARAAVWRFFLLSLVVCGVAVAALELVIGDLIPFFFGDEFADAVPLARILLIGSLFLGLRRVLTDGTRGAGEPTLGTVAEGITAAAAIPAVILVGTHAGAEGVAWALTASYAVGLAAMIAMTVVVLARPARQDDDPPAAEVEVAPAAPTPDAQGAVA
ncbi:MAG TPA: oligosaccharide flippase family protein [Solirubrobacteraceae bacterium]|jgi:O-antigen/teichoic acid export membrane protein